MPTDLVSVIKAERDALAAETRIAHSPPFVAANDLHEVARLPVILRAHHPATVKPLAPAGSRAFVISCPSLESAALWVDTSSSRYVTDYLTFLNTEHGLTIDRVPPPFDVDHLYNAARARAYGLKFVRTALVAHGVNRSHGAGPERDVTKNEALRSPGSGLKLMDELTCMKYFGFLAPLRSDPRDSEVQAYAAFAAAKLGLDAKEVIASIKYLRAKASTPWARKP